MNRQPDFLFIFVCLRYITQMKNLIYINACMRAGSRTRRIATPIIEELRKRYNFETVDLTKNLYAEGLEVCKEF